MHPRSARKLASSNTLKNLIVLYCDKTIRSFENRICRNKSLHCTRLYAPLATPQHSCLGHTKTTHSCICHTICHSSSPEVLLPSSAPCRTFATATEQASQIPAVTLNDGANLPLLGLGDISWPALSQLHVVQGVSSCAKEQ